MSAKINGIMEEGFWKIVSVALSTILLMIGGIMFVNILTNLPYSSISEETAKTLWNIGNLSLGYFIRILINAGVGIIGIAVFSYALWDYKRKTSG